MTMPEGTVFSLYGDLAFSLRVYLITPFKGAILSDQERIFNSRMSKLRSSVEWTFGKVLSLFAFVDYTKNQKLFLQPVAKYYLVASLLTNCHTCLYGSVTSEYFYLSPLHSRNTCHDLYILPFRGVRRFDDSLNSNCCNNFSWWL